MVSQRDIALKAGVSIATVSRALRGLSCVNKEQRAKIQAVADELCYRPDPMLQNLMHRRSRKIAQSSGVTIAWIGGGGPKWRSLVKPIQNHPYCLYYDQAECDLDKLGFRLQEFSNFGVQNPTATENPSTTERVLRARGIPGILLGPHFGVQRTLPIVNPDRFSLIQVGRSRVFPGLDRVASDAFHAMTVCLHRLKDAGYQRIGFYDSFGHSQRLESRWEAAFILEQYPDIIPPLLIDDATQAFNSANLQQYVEDHQLDAVISGRHAVWAWVQGGGPLAGLGCASPNLFSASGPFPGVVTDPRTVASVAVQLLVDSIYADRRGLNDPARTTSLQGHWYPG